MPIINRIAAFHTDMTAWRRDIHAHPETAFEEHRTSEVVAKKLVEFGIEVHRGLAGTGVIGTLKAGSGRRAIGLRADLDALHIHEKNGFEHVSQNQGKMHACGHDGHTTMLLGAARYLAETKNFDGTVHFIFQPAEENEGGGRAMVEQGLFEKFPVEAVYGMHNWPGVPDRHLRHPPRPDDGRLRYFRDHGHRPRRPRRHAASGHRPGGDGGADRHGAADHRQPQQQPGRRGGRERDADPWRRCLERHSRRGRAARHVPLLQAGDPRDDRAGDPPHRRGNLCRLRRENDDALREALPAAGQRDPCQPNRR